MSFPEIPQTRNELIRQIATFLCGDKSHGLPRIANAIVNSPATWTNPHGLAKELTSAAQALGKHLTMYVVTDPGTVGLLLEDDPRGIVFGYYVQTPDSDVDAHQYLIIRLDGLAWNPALTAREAHAASRVSHECDSRLLAAHSSNAPAVEHICRNLAQYLGETLRTMNDAERRALWVVRRRLWLLQNAELTVSERQAEFSTIYMLLTTLLEEFGLNATSIMTHARNRTSIN